MAEYKLANGYVLTDEEIEARAGEWGDGTWKGQLVEPRAGRPIIAKTSPGTCDGCDGSDNPVGMP